MREYLKPLWHRVCLAGILAVAVTTAYVAIKQPHLPKRFVAVDWLS
jgi:hypothetical protein